MTITPGLMPGLSNDDYHALTDWWGSTQLKTYLPEHYKPFAGNSEALSFGSLVHTLALEPALMSQYVALDAVTIGVKADGTPAANPLMTAAWKRAAAEVETDGYTVIAKADLDRATAMVDAIHDHPVARGLLFSDDGVSEESAFWVDDNGVQHKARFDRRIPGAIIDVKTTSAQPGGHSLSKAVINYGYEVATAHYLTVADGLGLDVDTFIHVWVSKSDPYRVTVTELDDYFLERGRDLRSLALERAAGRSEPYEGATEQLLLACPGWASPDDEEMVV